MKKIIEILKHLYVIGLFLLLMTLPSLPDGEFFGIIFGAVTAGAIIKHQFPNGL